MNIPDWFHHWALPLHSELPKVVVVVGSSGVGKTTAVDPLRNKNNFLLYGSSWSDFPTQWRWVVVPKRYITRAPRSWQPSEENINVTREQFLALLWGGEIFFPWKRDLWWEDREFYWFESLTSIDGSIRSAWRGMKYIDKDWPSTPYFSGNTQSVIVLSGNNAIGKKVAKIVWETGRSDVLVVGISLSKEERERRIRQRNPEMFTLDPVQMSIRLADPSDQVEGHSHLVLENNGTIEELSQRFTLLIREIRAWRMHAARSVRWWYTTDFYPLDIGFSD